MADANDPANVAIGNERLSDVQRFFSANDPFKEPSGKLSDAQRCAKAIFAASCDAFQVLYEYHNAVRGVATGLIKFITSVRENPTIPLNDAVPPLLEIIDKGLVDALWPERPSHFWKNINQARIILCDFSCRLPRSLLLEGVQMDVEPDRGGSDADIYKATYRGSQVAVKKFRTYLFKGSDPQSEKFRHMLHREIILHHGLRHSNICPLIGAITRENSKVPVAYPVTPWYECGPITDFLGGDKFVREKAFRFLVEISDGLLYLHQEGIAHGNLHPGNILVDDEEHIKLCDAGGSTQWDPRLTSSSTSIGAAKYMAPEIISADAKEIRAALLSDLIQHTPESDVYSFGVVCWTIFTEAPLSLDKQAPKRPEVSGHRAIPDELWKIMLKCWRDRPKERIPSVFLRVELRVLTRLLLDIDVHYPDSEGAR